MRILFGKILQLVFGGLIGCVVGGIVTGNENYWIAVAVGFPLLFTVGGIFGALGVRRQRADGNTVPVRRGIISTIPGMRPAPPPQQAVLNPVSTAQPASGIVLNGEVVGGAAPAPAPTPAPDRLPVWWRALSILTMAAGAVLVLIPAFPMIAWTASDVVAGRPFDGRDMIHGLHQQDAFDQLAGVMDGTEVISISFFGDGITVAAPTSPGARTIDRFEWKGGVASRLGPDYSQPDDVAGELFDAADIDLSIVAALVRQSLDDADIEGVDSIYPIIRRAGAGEDPVIGIPISGSYYDAYYSYTTEGVLIQRTGSAFD